MLAFLKALVAMGFLNPVALVKVVLPFVNDKVELVNEILSEKLGVRKVFLAKLLGIETYLDGLSEEEFNEVLKVAKEAVQVKLRA